MKSVKKSQVREIFEGQGKCKSEYYQKLSFNFVSIFFLFQRYNQKFYRSRQLFWDELLSINYKYKPWIEEKIYVKYMFSTL